MGEDLTGWLLVITISVIAGMIETIIGVPFWVPTVIGGSIGCFYEDVVEFWRCPNDPI